MFILLLILQMNKNPPFHDHTLKRSVRTGIGIGMRQLLVLIKTNELFFDQINFECYYLHSCMVNRSLIKFHVTLNSHFTSHFVKEKILVT